TLVELDGSSKCLLGVLSAAQGAIDDADGGVSPGQNRQCAGPCRGHRDQLFPDVNGAAQERLCLSGPTIFRQKVAESRVDLNETAAVLRRAGEVSYESL